jgi:phage shock protein PspC (stress-responsive transcriptional regulator)
MAVDVIYIFIFFLQAVGCSVLIALYFIVKTIRTKARKSKSKK